MKKLVLLLMATFVFASITKASPSDVKNQYVKWEDLPTVSQTDIIVYLKKAMRGENISGAKVRATPESYIAVWGKSFYDKVMNTNDFIFTTSKGGEINHGLTAEGRAVTSGTLSSGVRILALSDGTPVVKWGSNGCLNALLPSVEVDEEDPDNGPYAKKVIPPSTNGGGNINTLTLNSNSREITWNEGLGIHKNAREEVRADYDAAALMFMTIQNSKPSSSNCCGGSTASATTVAYAQPTMYAQPVMYAQQPTMMAPASAQQVAQNTTSTVIVRNKANGWDIANTVLNGANTYLGFVNTYRGVRLEGNRNTTYYSNQNQGYSNTWNTGYANPSGGFQGSNQPGFTTSGSGYVSNPTIQTGFGLGTSTNTGTGTYGNGWGN